jgi:hypothetical protein
MKCMMMFGLLQIAVMLGALCGCESASHRNPQNQQTDGFKSIDPIVNDRSTWVDPVR